jgi:hypothetical protein
VNAFVNYQTPAPAGPLPVLVAAAGPARQQRLTVFFRILLAVPHYFVLYFLGIAAGVVVFIGWWAALFTGLLPDFAVTFTTGYIRWLTRVTAYVMLLTDAYPPFSFEDDPRYPVRLAVAERDRLNRVAVFFRLILVIPASILRALVVFGSEAIVSFIAWLIVLFAGQMPASLHQAYTAVLRYSARVDCYLYLLTPAYPGGLLGDGPAGPPEWQLRLTPSARQLVILFVALGVLFSVVWIIVLALLAGTASTPSTTTTMAWLGRIRH